jgi:gluconate 2-dehydrogenase gamma chain
MGPLAIALPHDALKGGTVLSPTERATLEAVAERLIPTDELGPGAVDAGAVIYIERALDGPHAKHAGAYSAGIAAIEAAAAARHGAGFCELDAPQQDAILASFEQSSQRSERDFFELTRTHVLEGMFGDPSWGGNIDRAGWRLLDYPGPRRVWTEHEQQLDVRPDDEEPS